MGCSVSFDPTEKTTHFTVRNNQGHHRPAKPYLAKVGKQDWTWEGQKKMDKFFPVFDVVSQYSTFLLRKKNKIKNKINCSLILSRLLSP